MHVPALIRPLVPGLCRTNCTSSQGLLASAADTDVLQCMQASFLERGCVVAANKAAAWTGGSSAKHCSALTEYTPEPGRPLGVPFTTGLVAPSHWVPASGVTCILIPAMLRC